MKTHILFRCNGVSKNNNIMEKIKFEEVQSLLDSGKQPKEIFDRVDVEAEGFRVVELNEKYNYLDVNGKLLSPDQWFDYCWYFQEGFGIVELNYKRNYLKPDGTLLSDTWFDDCQDFDNGFAKVVLNGETCYINQNGELLHKIE